MRRLFQDAFNAFGMFLIFCTCLGIAVVGLTGWAAFWIIAHVRIRLGVV
jgi:hypothetical protein